MSDLYSNMYGQPDDEPEDDEGPKELPVQNITAILDKQSVSINIDGKSVMVPTFSYVKAMERDVETAKRRDLKQKNEIKALRAKVNELTREINIVKRDLDKKVDLRS